MKQRIESIDTTVSVNVKEEREPWQRPVMRAGIIYVGDPDDYERAPDELTPAQARELAAALLRAADEAESGTSEEARLRTELTAVNDALRDAGIDYPQGARGVRDLAAMLKLAREGD